MHTRPFELPHGTPSRIRVCLHSLVIIGIFAMHNVLVGHDSAHATVGESSAAATSHAAAVDHHDPTVSTGSHAPMAPSPSMPSMSDCCELVMVCLSMIMGIGALLLVRRKAADRVLWQLPPPSRLEDVLRLPPIDALTPLQRSSILRC